MAKAKKKFSFISNMDEFKRGYEVCKNMNDEFNDHKEVYIDIENYLTLVEGYLAASELIVNLSNKVDILAGIIKNNDIKVPVLKEL